MADTIYDFDPVAANNQNFAGIPYGPNQLYHNQIDNLFRAYGGALGGFVDDLGAVATPTGSATAVAVTLSQGFTGYGTAAGEIRHGTLIALKMPWAASGAATLNVNSLGTKKIRRQGDAAIEADDWLANGIYFLRYDTAYDSANGAWVLMNAATSGVVYLTNAQAVAGTKTDAAANAANLAFVTDGYTTTATAAGTTTLTNESTPHQYFTGTTTQTIVLPVASTLNLGRTFRIVNNSTGNLTVQSSGANNIVLVGPGTTVLLTCILTSGTTAASWDFDWQNIITPWVAYTPTFTGFGTATNISFFSRRVGSDLQVKGRFTVGTSTGAEARISLGFNGTDGNVTVDSTVIASIRNVGVYTLSVVQPATYDAVVLAEPSVGYITFGVANASNAGLTKVAGSIISASTNVLSVDFSVPISGW